MKINMIKVAAWSVPVLTVLTIMVLWARSVIESSAPEATGTSSSQQYATIKPKIGVPQKITVSSVVRQVVEIPPDTHIGLRWTGDTEVPFIIHYNGGKIRGGDDIIITEHSRWPSNYVFPDIGWATEVSFQTQPEAGSKMTEVEITLTKDNI